MTRSGVPQNKSFARAPAFVAGLLALAACATVETQSFVIPDNSRIESARIAVGADFSKYDRLQATDMGIYFPEGKMMSDEDLQRLRQTFRNAFSEELEAYSISRQPGPTTMTVEASLIDLREAGSTAAAAASMRREIRDMATPGALVFLMQLKDSQTGQILARAADSAKAPAFGTGGSAQTDWLAVDDAAAHWAELFRMFLDDNLGVEAATP
ncbi:MAG: DUF3313 family protein [Woeseiaceae bacterium]|jgi:hypothetical protein